MTGEQLATLVNIGVGGAVIAVVILFLRFIKERDAEWRSFFTAIREGDNAANTRLTAAIEKLVIRVEGVEGSVDRLEERFILHDATEMEFLRGFVVSASKEPKTQPRRRSSE